MRTIGFKMIYAFEKSLIFLRKKKLYWALIIVFIVFITVVGPH